LVDVGNEALDTRVERALAERAIGYTVDVEEVFLVKGKLESRIVRKYYPPDGKWRLLATNCGNCWRWSSRI
jgi:hypothetical protein